MRAALLVVLLLPITVAAADASTVGNFDPHAGAAVPAQLAFREGRIGDYFGRAPVVLVLGYLGCTNLCGTTLNGVAQALHDTGLVPERDYRALFVSIDPRDERAPPERRPGWHFLTGAASAARVARVVGFDYQFEKESGQYAHPAGFVVLTPEGRVSRYFEGVRFDSGELKQALSGAGQGKTSNAFEQLLLVCFHDPENGRYTATILASIRVAMIALLAGAAFFAWRRLR
ncbi:MAG TPA: SCO family protein [Burkholderiales bacterium]|nr:SCO family protein [Burkholderiales bacterium]